MGFIQNSNFKMCVLSESLPNAKHKELKVKGLEVFKLTHQNTQSCSIQPVSVCVNFLDIDIQERFVHLLVLCIADQLTGKDLKADKSGFEGFEEA